MKAGLSSIFYRQCSFLHTANCGLYSEFRASRLSICISRAQKKSRIPSVCQAPISTFSGNLESGFGFRSVRDNRLRCEITGKRHWLTTMSSSGPTHKKIVDQPTHTISFEPLDGHYDALVIIAHGLGDSAKGFEDVANMFSQAESMQRVKFILPTAPLQPVTLNGGCRMNSWYDIVSLDPSDGMRNGDAKGIENSKRIIEKIIDSENQSRGVAYNRMILAGFSQGGALSLFTGLQLPHEKKLAGILCLSGYLAGRSKFQMNLDLVDTPIFHCHGTADPLVLHEFAVLTKDLLCKSGIKQYTLKSFPGMEHTVCMEELNDALKFVETCLSSSGNQSVVVEKPIESMNASELKAAITKAGLGNKAIGLLEKKELVELLKRHGA